MTEWAWKTKRRQANHVGWGQLRGKKTEENTTNRLETKGRFSQQCPDCVSDSSCCSQARARQEPGWQRVMGQQCLNWGSAYMNLSKKQPVCVFAARTHLIHARLMLLPLLLRWKYLELSNPYSSYFMTPSSKAVNIPLFTPFLPPCVRGEHRQRLC